VPPAAPLGRGGPFLASGGPLRPGVAKLEGVAFRCKGLLRKKEATPAFKLVQYATMGRQGARQTLWQASELSPLRGSKLKRAGSVASAQPRGHPSVTRLGNPTGCSTDLETHVGCRMGVGLTSTLRNDAKHGRIRN